MRNPILKTGKPWKSLVVIAVLAASISFAAPVRAAITIEGMCGTIAQGAIQDKTTKWRPHGTDVKTAATLRSAVVNTSNVAGPRPDLYVKLDDKATWYFIMVKESGNSKGSSVITCKAYVDGAWNDVASFEGPASVSGTGKTRFVAGQVRLFNYDCWRGVYYAGVATLGNEWTPSDSKGWSGLWEAKKSESGAYFTLKKPVRYRDLEAAWWKRATTVNPAIPDQRIHTNPKDNPFHPDNVSSKGADADTFFTVNYTKRGATERYVCYTYSGVTGGWEYAGEYSSRNGVAEYASHYPVFTQRN